MNKAVVSTIGFHQPTFSGQVTLTGYGKGYTDRILTIQSNNGELYCYGDGSSAFHFAGVPCYFDQTVYFGGGFSFPTYGTSFQGNGTNLIGFAQGWFNAGAVGTVQTGTDWNAGQARDDCNFVVKNRREDVGNATDKFSFSTWSEVPDSSPVEYELKASITSDGHFYDNGKKLATEELLLQKIAELQSQIDELKNK